MPVISGDKIEFVGEKIPHKARSPKISDKEINLIKDEIDKVLTKSIIKETCHEKKEFVSPIFISHKSNGGIRLILHLEQLNKNIEYHHFKMNSINIILNLIIKDCFMALIDLKDAYYSVKISENFQRYLKFEFFNKLYKFVCFPNGLALCPRITKVPLR